MNILLLDSILKSTPLTSAISYIKILHIQYIKEVKNLTPRTGRPPIENAKRNNYMLRMTNEELEKLNYCQKVTGLSKAEVIRLGIEKVFQESLKNKN